MSRRLSALALTACLASTVTACASDNDDAGGSGGSGGSKTVTVLAAASLSTSFTEIGKKFEAAHDGVTVRFSFGGSADLVEQIKSGAPADVFASADTKNMAKLAGDVSDPKNFATNTLEIAVPPGNPAHIASLADLTKSGVKLVICAAAVPCGSAAQTVAKKAGLTFKPVSEEQSVTDVLGKVESGEADAGLVYVTDVQAAGNKVKGVTFPESSDAVNTYPIAEVKDSKNDEVAKEFVDFVLGADGQRVLADAGFAKA